MVAVTTAGYPWDRSSVNPQSPDTASPVYPDRPIRPLPKRRLRSRLSTEQADNITYPPIPPSSSPLYGSPQSQSDRSFVDPRYSREVSGVIEEQDHVCDCGGHHSADDSEEDEIEADMASSRNIWPDKMTKFARERSVNLPSQPPPPNSSTSSADGYESFENTNNKKKRKIPVSGGPGVPIPSSLDDLNSGVTGDGGYPNTVLANGGQQHGSGSGIGLSGPGRGRHSRTTGRVLNERKPLMNTLANGMYPDKGIISTAMANAKDPAVFAVNRGQENMSMLQRQKQVREGSQSFTFECKSDSSDKMAMSRPPLPPPLTHSNIPSASRGGPVPSSTSVGAPPAHYAAANQNHAAPQPPAKPRKTKHEIFEAAARRRKNQKQIDNFHNPPDPNKPDDNYKCWICEYALWWGQPPRAFMRAYETKDHKERKAKEANRRRLEQAKAKGRKGKKSKASSKNNNSAPVANNQTNSQPYDPANEFPPQDDGSQGDDFFDDDYDHRGHASHALDDDEYDAQSPPPLPSGQMDYRLPGLDRSQSLPNM